ncbi:non-ribosomal peptide synthetase [Streptomyces sp. NBRC 110611]|uniref:non-ribosomal peptide synthetase n=1 Tax=Streptomyces sp. NBRC 110611 TaxID=1621259 RepID=UPI000835E9A9|nr:non-ribosomal peptide synthetase [Streptomyces sp. NBRC 110611]GAU69251.1 non-ribosomal peptide synthetase [Streptomyces sp. NBRC 110611]
MLSITHQYLDRFRRLDDGGEASPLLPVTGAQRRFVLVRAMDPTGRPDLVPMFFSFPRGTVDLRRLAAAARRLAALHPVLRGRPAVLRATPVLRLGPPEVPVERVACAPGESAADALRRVLRAWAPQGPPLRLFLTEEGAAAADDRSGSAESGAFESTDQAREVLAVVLDHAACDGSSLARIVEELGAAYAAGGTAEGLSPADVAAEVDAYREAVLLQLDEEARAASPAALEYWGDRLRAVRECAPPPGPQASAPDGLPSGSADLSLPVPAGGASFPQLLDACRAAAAVLYGRGHVVPLGYPWGGRPPGAAPVLGCFLNTVVFPTATGQAAAAPEETAGAWWDDLDRAATPFDEVVHAARAAGSGWTGRLDGLLTVDDARRRPPLRLGGVTGRETHIDGRPVRGPFAVSVTQGPEIHLRMVWDRAVHSDDTAEAAFAALTDALRAPAPMAG